MAYNRKIEGAQPAPVKVNGKRVPTPLEQHIAANRSMAAERASRVLAKKKARA